MVTVFRGANGTTLSIPVRDLVVGDVVDISAGDRVPADCILIEEMNISVDQSMYFHGDDKVDKEESVFYGDHAGHEEDGHPDNHTKHPDPFLYTDSKILTG